METTLNPNGQVKKVAGRAVTSINELRLDELKAQFIALNSLIEAKEAEEQLKNKENPYSTNTVGRLKSLGIILGFLLVGGFLYEYIIKNDLSMKPIDLAGIQKVIISIIVYFLAILITEKSIKFFVPGVFDYFMNDLNTEPDFTQHFKSLQPWQSICITCFFTVRRCDWVIFLGFYISAVGQMVKPPFPPTSSVGKGQSALNSRQLARKSNPSAQSPIPISQSSSSVADSRYCLVKMARSQVWVREKTGHNDGLAIGAYLKPLGFREGTPYCGAFLDWVFRQCGVSHHVASPAVAFSWITDKTRRIWYWGKPISDVVPQQGDVAVFNWRQRYHCELIVEWIDDEDEEDFMTIGGNTSAIKGDASGEGVHRKISPKDIAVVSRMF